MQEIGGALEHLAMAETSNKDIVSILTEPVNFFTCNNASLTTQLSNAVRIIIEMANKLNIKPTKYNK